MRLTGDQATRRGTSVRSGRIPGRILGLTLTVLMAAMVAGIGIAVQPAAPAAASHFRAAQLNWTPAGGTTVHFTISDAFRRDGYSCVNPATGGPKACTAPDGRPGIGDVFLETIGGTVFSPGDGSTIASPYGPLLYEVSSIDPANNNLFGDALDPASLPAVNTTISHTYPSTGNFTAFAESCCRISSLVFPNAHINNPDGEYRIETVVNVGGTNSSPVSALPPIVNCPINAVCSFQVPGSDPNGDPLRFRLSTSAEAGGAGSFVQPGPPQAPNAASISSSGLYTWNTTGATLGPTGYNTLYSTQIMIEDLDAQGNPKSKTPVDFFIQLVPSIGVPPQFVSPTPTCGSTQTVAPGNTLSFTVKASDADSGDSVSLNATGLPAGATMTPSLPTSANPVSSVFSWIPSAAQTGTYVVTFSATDSTLQQTLCSVTINVKVADTTGPSCALTGVVAGPPKQIQITVQDTGSGLASVQVIQSTNADTVVPPFSVGTTAPVVVTATKIDQTQGSQVGLTITDVAGNSTTCDPIDALVVRDAGKPAATTLTAVPQAEGTLTITNGPRGVSNLEVTVNGQTFKVTGLKDNEVRTLDISAAMRPGTNNTVAVTARGPKDATVGIMLWDGQGQP